MKISSHLTSRCTPNVKQLIKKAHAQRQLDSKNIDSLIKVVVVYPLPWPLLVGGVRCSSQPASPSIWPAVQSLRSIWPAVQSLRLIKVVGSYILNEMKNAEKIQIYVSRHSRYEIHSASFFCFYRSSSKVKLQFFDADRSTKPLWVSLAPARSSLHYNSVCAPHSIRSTVIVNWFNFSST